MGYISIIIATYNRPVLLKRALRSILDQDCIGELDVEIVIVDNSADRSAEQTIHEIAANSPIAIKYVSEARQNISLARNAGLVASIGTMVAFIDDDERASPHWLRSLIATQQSFQADVVFGPVHPEFEGGIAPVWESTESFYDRDAGIVTGTPVTLGGTGNVLIRRECFTNPEPFDPAYGKTGGEDTDFFQRISQDGFSSVWCAEAHVTEFLPKARCSQLYLFRRAFKSNQSFVRVERKNSRYGMVAGAYWFVNGLVQAIALALPALGLSLSRGPTAVRIKRRFFGALGKVLSVSIFNYEFYGNRRNSTSARNPL